MPRAAEGSKVCRRKWGCLLAAQVPEKPFEPVSQQQSYKYIITRTLNLGRCFKTKFLLRDAAIFHSQEFAIKGWDIFFIELNLPS